jgi:hypothetical protein
MAIEATSLDPHRDRAVARRCPRAEPAAPRPHPDSGWKRNTHCRTPSAWMRDWRFHGSPPETACQDPSDVDPFIAVPHS